MWYSDTIVRIDPATGVIDQLIDAGAVLRNAAGMPQPLRCGDALNGIAIDPDSGEMWLTGKNWPAIFSVRLVDPTPAPTTPEPTPTPTSAPTTSEPTPSPTPAPATYCREGYGDYGVWYNWGIGKITIATSHEACSARCTQYSAPQYLGGCKGYMTGMYYGMLYCRSYGGNLRTTGCAPWAVPTNPGEQSGALGSVHPRTNTVNFGGNCCSNSTFVGLDLARQAK